MLGAPAAGQPAPSGRRAADALPGGTPQDPPPLVLAGQLFVGDQPADSGTVVLHRVSAFSSGAVDSARVDSQGRFRFALSGWLRGPADQDAAPALAGFGAGDVYFASASHQGVLYFGGPVAERADTEGNYEIRAYPAVGAREGSTLPLRVRNTFVERASPGPGWQVTDLFEIDNRTRTTVVASEQGPAWSHALPSGAVNFEVGPSDLNPDAASFRDGRVQTSSAVPPGESVYLFRYRIPTDGFELPLGPGTRSMELLFREPAGQIEVAGLAAVDPVDMEGGTFRRFAGRDLAASVVTVARGSAFNPSESVPLVAVVLALALTVAGALLMLRGSPARAGGAARSSTGPQVAAGGRSARSPRRAVLVEIARLDEERSRGAVDAEEHARRRARLVAELGR